MNVFIELENYTDNLVFFLYQASFQINIYPQQVNLGEETNNIKQQSMP